MILRKLTCFVFFFVTAFSAKAQNENEKKLDLGFKVSPLLLSWLHSDDGYTNSDGSFLGFSYGVTGDFYFSSHYAISTELTITNTGGKLKTENTTNNTVINGKYKINYIEIPVSLKLRTNEINNFSYYGQFGLSNGIKIKSKTEEVTKENGSNVPVDSVLGKANVFRLGLLMGAGLQYHIDDNTKVQLGLAFNNGFTNIFSSTDGGVSSSYLSLNIGVLF